MTSPATITRTRPRSSNTCSAKPTPIVLPAVPYRHHQHHETVVLDAGNHSIIADAVAPQPFTVAAQRVADTARIVGAGNAFAQIAQHTPFGVRAELAQVADGFALKLDPP